MIIYLKIFMKYVSISLHDNFNKRFNVANFTQKRIKNLLDMFRSFLVIRHSVFKT
jgi:hypothetical protein